jgi:hypothetical protein
MAVTAKFVANFDSFYGAVQKAEAQILDLSEGADKAQKSLDRMVTNFSGRKLVQDATLMAEAVERIGGASKLTEKELQSVGAKAAEASDKLRAMGQVVPAGIQKIADAASDARRETEGWIPILHSLGTSWVARIAEGILLRDIIRGIIGQIKDMAAALPELVLKGASIADVRENFDHLTESAGLLGQQLLGTLRKGTHDTIDDFALMKTVNQGLVAGLHLTEEQFGVLAKGAFALAQATGGDVKTALEAMNDAMVTGKTKAIALLTGKIDLESAETKYATSLGKSRENLTDLGKLEASRAAILDAVSAATGRLGEQTDGLDEKVAQANVAWTNFADDLGEAIATSETLGAAIDGVKKFLIDTFGGNQKSLITAIKNAIDDATVAIIGFGSTGAEVAGFLVKEYYAVKKLFGDLVQVFELAEKVSAQIDIAKATTAAFMGNQQAKKDIAERKALIEQLTASIKARGEALQSDDKAQSEVDATTAKYIARLRELKVNVEAASQAHGPFVQAFNSEAEAHKAAGDGAKKHGDELTKLTDKEKAAIEKFKTASKNIDDLSTDFDVLDGSVEEAIKYFLRLGASQSDLATYFGVSVGAIKRIDDSLKLFDQIHSETFKLAQENQKQYREETLKTAHVVNESLASQLAMQKDFQNQLRDMATAGNPGAQLLQQWTDALNKLGPPMQGFEAQWQRTVDAIDATFSAKMAQTDWAAAVAGAGRDAARGFAGEFFKVIDEIPSLLKQALTGGGGFSGATSALGASLGATLGNALSTSSASQGLADGIAKLFNVKTAGASGAVARGVSGAIVAGAAAAGSGAFGTAAQFATAGASIGFMVGGPVGAGIGAAIGGGASLVTSAFKKLFHDSEKEINPVRQAFVDMAGGLAELNKKAHDAGLTLDHLLNAKNPEMYQKAIEELNAAFKFQDDAIQTLLDTARKYGFTLEELGPALQKQELGKQAEEIYKDFQVLTAGGLDHVAVLTRMADGVNDYIKNAAAMGIEVPSQMEPLLKQMIDLGLLTDKDGNKIEDLAGTGVTFSTTMTEGFKSVVAAVEKLAAAISGKLGTAIANIPADINVGVHFNVDDLNLPDDHKMALGGSGRVTKPTLFLAGEAGAEDFAFSGGGKSFGNGNDETAGLLRQLLEAMRGMPRAFRDGAQGAAV